MKPLYYILYLLVPAGTLALHGCGNTQGDASHTDNTELAAARDSIASLTAKVDELNAEIELLKFPADQRLTDIKRLISSEKFSEARNMIAELRRIFPNSEEAAACQALLEHINKAEAAIIAEQERIRALGFKALTQSTVFEIGPNKVTFSNLSFGSQFTFDAYDDSWFYRTADRGNVYALASMSVTSSDKNPQLPTPAIYSIKGEKLEKIEVYTIEFARWRDYGAYLGNYSDNANDFAKVSTVRFKLGCEVPETVKNSPYIIVLKMENTQSRKYDRFRNPPYWYNGADGYPSTLSLEDFNGGNYRAIKIGNLK